MVPLHPETCASLHLCPHILDIVFWRFSSFLCYTSLLFLGLTLSSFCTLCSLPPLSEDSLLLVEELLQVTRVCYWKTSVLVGMMLFTQKLILSVMYCHVDIISVPLTQYTPVCNIKTVLQSFICFQWPPFYCLFDHRQFINHRCVCVGVNNNKLWSNLPSWRRAMELYTSLTLSSWCIVEKLAGNQIVWLQPVLKLYPHLEFDAINTFQKKLAQGHVYLCCTLLTTL